MSGASPTGIAQVLTVWTSSPVADALLVLALVAYLGAIHRYRRTRRRRWPAVRTVCWVLGVALAAACVNSALAVYSRELLWVHMIVHLLMIDRKSVV